MSSLLNLSDIELTRLNKWVELLELNDPDKDTLLYNIFKKIKLSHNDNINNCIIDEYNNDEINKRVISKTKQLEKQIQEIKEDKENIELEYDKIKSRHDIVVSENINIKESRNNDIQSLIKTSNESKDTIIESKDNMIEHKDDMINFLKNELNNKIQKLVTKTMN